MAHPETPGFEAQRFRSLAWVAAIGLVLATVCNGAGVYLKRVGWLDQASYAAYWSSHCAALQFGSSSAPAEPRCSAAAISAQMTDLETSARPPGEYALSRNVYRSSGAELAFKLAKDAFGLALIAISLVLLVRRVAPRPTLQQSWPVGALLACAGVALVTSLLLYEPLIALSGARSFMFMGLALLGLWLVPQMALLASAVAALLAVQVLLMPFELLYGMHLSGHFHSLPLAGRLSGTLVAPNTLGVFAVCALAFYHVFAPNRRWLWLVALMALTLVLLSGSGTGMLAFGLYLLLALMERVVPDHRLKVLVAGSLILAMLVAALPELMGRPNKFESLWERVDGLRTVLAGQSFWESIFGSGLGMDTNTARMLVSMLGADVFPRYVRFASGVQDSMLTSLLIQLGLVGVLLFYGALAWAAMQDHQARLFYAIVAACSLTLQITELFPVNVLLGVALAHSVVAARRTRLVPGHG